MLFNSYTFIVFFLVVLAMYRLPLSWRFRKFNLLWASYLFYAAWNPPFIVLLWISTVVDWWVAKAIQKEQRLWARKALLGVSLAVGLGMLGFFKYGGFLLDSFVHLLAQFGIVYQPALPSVVLPVGISFYTFLTLSYTIDVYRRQMTAWHSFLDYCFYVTFFPHLVAGPILRARDFLPQCPEPRSVSREQMGWGLAMMVLGLFEKIVLADGLFAPVVEDIYGAAGPTDAVGAWAGTLAFAGQIFCDFGGYSTCAIGAALCLGFNFINNFRCPYAALGFSDFWRRWHISLSSWLRDYLYIPLGGNRKGAGRTQVNLMLTMLLGGLWHGAAWTFVVWGGLHGLYLVIERGLRKVVRPRPVFATRWFQFGMVLITLAGVLLTWVFFRAGTFGQAYALLAAMIGHPIAAPEILLGRLKVLGVAAAFAALFATHWFMRDAVLEDVVERTPWWLRAVALAAMLLAILVVPGDDRAFIYFQF
jgi:alginate O-acetyltransferase complex protein AlgI